MYRLAAAERELGRRRGPSSQGTVALPPTIELYRDEIYAARVPGAPGPAALRHRQVGAVASKNLNRPHASCAF